MGSAPSDHCLVRRVYPAAVVLPGSYCYQHESVDVRPPRIFCTVNLFGSCRQRRRQRIEGNVAFSVQKYYAIFPAGKARQYLSNYNNTACSDLCV